MKCFRFISRSNVSLSRVFSPSFRTISAAIALALFFPLLSQEAKACEFVIPDSNGNIAKGPSFELMDDGLTNGLLSCNGEIFRMTIMTIAVDISQKHIGVRDDPLFSTQTMGELKTVGSVPISDNARIHVLGRVNQSPRIGLRRGFVHFATLCDAADAMAPLNCSLGNARIKFRTTTMDTDDDEIVDHTFYELSVYQASGRLYMVSFATPTREQLDASTADVIAALRAFGLDVSRQAG
ncbi:MAG: hypothetical protein H2045_00210 [Rhizobiales bacterium]|nr:hypothetical protein [Hyphomicrobiales bacterium]